MEYRTGKCSQCGAEYQVPASFAHNKARCKKCGVGVVHFGSAARSAGNPGGADPPRPAAPEPALVRAAPPPAERATGGHESARPDEPRPERAPGARASSTPAPPRPRSEPREPAPGAAEHRPSEAGGRSARTALIAIGLLLVAAACFWLFYLRGRS
jgi:DNA-directed RNA polymerase subunit RPC12/RpoP